MAPDRNRTKRLPSNTEIRIIAQLNCSKSNLRGPGFRPKTAGSEGKTVRW